MKTPDEIKMGLECCLGDTYVLHCDDCPYADDDADTDDGCCDNGVRLFDDALTYIRQLEAQVPKWISVEERLPEKGERVLVTNGPKGGFVCESYLNVNGKWMRAGCELVFMTPHYWMPLPEPPKEEM